MGSLRDLHRKSKDLPESSPLIFRGSVEEVLALWKKSLEIGYVCREPSLYSIALDIESGDLCSDKIDEICVAVKWDL